MGLLIKAAIDVATTVAIPNAGVRLGCEGPCAICSVGKSTANRLDFFPSEFPSASASEYSIRCLACFLHGFFHWFLLIITFLIAFAHMSRPYRCPRHYHHT